MSEGSRATVQQMQLQRKATTSSVWQARWAGVSAFAAMLLLITGWAAQRTAQERDDLAIEYVQASAEVERVRGTLPRLVTDATGAEYLSYDGRLYEVADGAPVDLPVIGPRVEAGFVSGPLDWVVAIWERWAVTIASAFAAGVGALLLMWSRRRDAAAAAPDHPVTD